MPWDEVSVMTLRRELVTLAQTKVLPVSELARRFNVSRKTAYKWIRHAIENPSTDFADRARVPHHSPTKTDVITEQLIIKARLQFPEWGGRKLKRYLENEGHPNIPAASTVTQILKRHELLQTSSAEPSERWHRFEHEHPNDLWQMDFKGPIASSAGPWFALTVLDDHSRYSLGIKICRRQAFEETQRGLSQIFQRYGVPRRMTMDNGTPWGSAQRNRNWTLFTVWLMDQGIHVSHSRPYHPQTQGKDERFHRSLKIEVLNRHHFSSGNDLQEKCEQWRWLYNEKRPHDALGLAVPASRYHPSQSRYQSVVQPYEYSPTDITRRIQNGRLKFLGRLYNIGSALHQKTVAIRQGTEEGIMDVFYRHQRVARIDIINEG